MPFPVQMAFREQEREREAEAARQRRIKQDAEDAASRQRDKAQRAADRKAKAEALAEMRQCMIDEQRKRSTEHVFRIPEKDSWVHAQVLNGKHRGFANMSVPEAAVGQLLISAAAAGGRHPTVKG